MEGCSDNQLWEMVDLIKNVLFQYQHGHSEQCRHCHLLKKQEKWSPRMSLISLSDDDSEKTLIDQGQRRSHLCFRLDHRCHVQHLKSEIRAFSKVYAWVFSQD